MCTLTFIPLQKKEKEKHYVITANRDESPNRAADKYINRTIGNCRAWYPSEPVAGGSNFIVNAHGRVVTLLNGALKRHEHKPPYRRSRGLMVLDFLEFPNTNEFLRDYDLNGIEAFTLVSFEDEINEIRWDGTRVYLKIFSYNKPLIWSSTQLYDEPVRENRELWFNQFLNKEDNLTEENILNFHLRAGNGDTANDLVMNRNNMVRTISISQVSIVTNNKASTIKIYHYDLLKEKLIEVDLDQD